jgi:hypothetical protein
MKSILITLLLIISSAHAMAEADKLVTRAKVECQLSGRKVKFAGTSSVYDLYDKNYSQVELLECEKVSVGSEDFYTMLITGEQKQAQADVKVMTYEIALLNKVTNLLLTVRSEQFDQIDISSDLPNMEFSKVLTTKWGQSAKTKAIMIEMKVIDKNTVAQDDPYFLRLNANKTWFEMP